MKGYKKLNERAVLFGSNGIEDKGTYVDRFLAEQEAKEYGLDLTIEDVIFDLENAKGTLNTLMINANELSSSDSEAIKRILENLNIMLDKALSLAKDTDSITADYLTECSKIKAKRLGFKRV